MQDFRDNVKKTIQKVHQSAILDFTSAKFVMGFPCVSPYILFCMYGPAILRKYHKITQIKNGR